MMVRVIGVRIMVIMGDMIITMFKSQMRMRATIPEDNTMELLNTTLMVKIERNKTLLVFYDNEEAYKRLSSCTESEVGSYGDA